MQKLMLVGAKRVACPKLAEDVVLKHEVVSCDDDVAEKLLEQVRLDVANNEHPVWIKADSAEAKKILKEQADEKAEAEKVVAKRKRAARK